MKRSVLGRAMDVRAMPNDGGVGWSDPSAIPPNSSYSRELAGVVVNDFTALQLTTVFACLRIMSGSVGELPFDQYAQAPSGKRIPVNESAPIVASPFASMDRSEGFEQIVISLMTRGNAYLSILDTDRLGFPTGLDVIPPHQVRVTREKGFPVYRVNNNLVNTDEIVHIRWMTLPGGLVGLSPIEYAASAIGISLAAEEFGARFFAQGAQLGGVLQTDNVITQNRARRVLRQFQKRHSGISQAHLPMLLDGGLKWTPISVPPEQAQFLATRQFQRDEIAMLYGVPAHLLANTQHPQVPPKGMSDLRQDFVTQSVARYTGRIERAWDRITPPGLVHRFNFDALLRASLLERMQAYTFARTISLWSINNLLEFEDMEPLDPEKYPDGDNPFAPLNSAQNGQLTLQVGSTGDSGSGGDGGGN